MKHHIAAAFGAFLDILIALRLYDSIRVSAGNMENGEIQRNATRFGQVNNLSISFAEVRRVWLAKIPNVISLKL
jgi:hypothetical protein